jgi:hypothetical protein
MSKQFVPIETLRKYYSRIFDRLYSIDSIRIEKEATGSTRYDAYLIYTTTSYPIPFSSDGVFVLNGNGLLGHDRCEWDNYRTNPYEVFARLTIPTQQVTFELFKQTRDLLSRVCRYYYELKLPLPKAPTLEDVEKMAVTRVAHDNREMRTLLNENGEAKYYLISIEDYENMVTNMLSIAKDLARIAKTLVV